MSDGLAAPRVIKRSLVIAGHATSVSLEQPFWNALRDLAAADSISVAALAARVDGARKGVNLSSALRVHVLQALQARLALSSPAPAAATEAARPD